MIRHSRRTPGTLPAGAGKGLGLIDKEITVVVSDVEGSTPLWERSVLSSFERVTLTTSQLTNSLKKAPRPASFNTAISSNLYHHATFLRVVKRAASNKGQNKYTCFTRVLDED